MKNFKFISIIALSVFLLVSGLFISTKSASAVDSTLSFTTFTSWNKDGVVGYDAGLALSGGETFYNAQSIVVKLYSGSTLLQTNTAIGGKITGTEFLTPFDIFGSFNYAKDGYFVNKREAEYGQSLTPTHVTATVVFRDGKSLSATSTYLTVDGSCAPGHLFNPANGQPCPQGQVLGVKTFKFTSSLKQGAKGNEVMELQKVLNAKGYNAGIPDGKFGKMTKESLTRFQLANGLEGVGSVGPLTRALLNK